MNKTLYIHNYNNTNNLLNRYLVAIIPLLIFGFYKNGILLYQNDLINFKHLLLPLYFYLISIIIAVIITLITKENIKENKAIRYYCYCSSYQS